MRGLERGLNVLRVLQNAERPLSLHDIYLTSKISKPSLLRVLNSLEQHNCIRRGIADGLYRQSANFGRLHQPSHQHERLAAAGAPVLEKLCSQVKWPSDLMARSGYHLTLCESTRVMSPYYLDRQAIGKNVDMIFSAAGRAYLAFAPPAESHRIVAYIANRGSDLAQQLIRSGQLKSMLDETRRLGYGERDPSMTAAGRGDTDGTWAISVALKGTQKVHGCVNLVWTHKAFATKTIVAKYLKQLVAAAAEIVRRVESNSGL